MHVGRDPLTGKLRQVSRTTSKGIPDARRLRSRLITEVAEGKHGRTVPSLGALLDAWVEHLEKLGRSPTTLAEYRRKIEKVIRPSLGHRRLDTLTAQDLNVFYAQRLLAGQSARSVMHYHRIVGAALHQGERWGWIDRNVTKRATPPVLTPTTPTVPPPDRVRALIEFAAASRTPQMATIITVAALTCLRRGELCGLRWRDLDWNDRSVVVRRSVWQTGAGWGVKEPKAHQERRVAIGDQTIGVLLERQKRVEELAAAAETEISVEAYVFSSDLDGVRPLLPGTVTSCFAKLCRGMEAQAAQADPPRDETWAYRFHDLRHYSATQVFRAGHNPRTVASRLGQADGGAWASRL